MRSTLAETYTVPEIAAAAGVSVPRAEQALRAGGLTGRGTRVPAADAVTVVRRLRRGRDRLHALPLTVMSVPRAQRIGPLAVSAALHALVLLALITAASLHLLESPRETPKLANATMAHLVFLNELGPGGGGGGGGLDMPAPPPRAERRALVKPKVTSPVPRVQQHVTPPPRTRVTPKPAPAIVPRPDPVVVTPPALQAIVAPVQPSPADATDRAGLLTASTPQSVSAGPGTGGGAGSGGGASIGDGHGDGLGSGAGGGTGGGSYLPGSGITPPQLLREVRANYTDEARRHAIEGDVVLEIVVKRDGSVGSVRVLRSLGGGLEQRAIDAVRQWKFAPASRTGAPVDVVVEVSVDFRLR